MNVADYDYDLPPEFIAQSPAEPRDAARLMVLRRATGAIEHRTFRDVLALLAPGDVLVLNNTRVIPARLHAHKATGGAAELLLLRQQDDVHWLALVGGKRIRPGTELHFDAVPGLTVTVVAAPDDGPQRVVRFSQPVNGLLEQLGETPLPPYITASTAPPERYQTVYSRHDGSAAAPTAGLHFTPELLVAARDKGVQLAYCTLHVGLDTFRPVSAERVQDHRIHSEWASLSTEDAAIINRAKLAGGRVVAVGTTTARTLETAAILSADGDPANPAATPDACAWQPVTAFAADTRLFIYPGYTWRVVDALITNFHLPKSSLLMMISALAGRENVLHAYEVAKQHGYRFFSFGDAMFIG